MPDKPAGTLLAIKVDRNRTPLVVECSGRLVSGVNNLLYLEVSQLIPGNKRIVLDLNGLTHMDSMGIGTLVRLYVSARSAGCALELVNVGKPIRQLLGVTNLIAVFTIIGENNIKMG
jgi:anti-sigma B factor antagonist